MTPTFVVPRAPTSPPPALQAGQRLWTPGITLEHDPDSSEIYQWDLSVWLNGEALVGPPIVIAVGITAELDLEGESSVDIRLSGGAAGTIGRVTIRATTATHRRTEDFTVNFSVIER